MQDGAELNEHAGGTIPVICFWVINPAINLQAAHDYCFHVAFKIDLLHFVQDNVEVVIFVDIDSNFSRLFELEEANADFIDETFVDFPKDCEGLQSKVWSR